MSAETDMGVTGRVEKPPVTQGRGDSLERRRGAYKFFSDLITGAHAEQREGEWTKAHEKYEDDAETPHMVNMWRAKIDTQAAFLNSEPAVLRFSVPTANVDDERAERRMKCEQAVYDYIFDEMGYQPILDQMAHSADITNVGFVAHQPDTDKWLPALLYLEPDQVAVDASCGANMGDAGWVAYLQYMSPDELHAQYPDVPLADFRRAAAMKGFQPKYAKDAEAEAARDRITEDGADAGLKQCRIWRQYARGAYALYDRPPDEEGKPVGGEPAGSAARPGAAFETPEGEAKRYLILVEGMDVPLVDIMRWPRELLLDKGEWPITKVAYNRARDSIYGFPDYRHEKQLLHEIERVVKDIAARHGMEGLKIGTARALDAKVKAGLKALLEQDGIQVLDDIIDEQGKQLVQVLDLPVLTTEDLTYLNTLIELYDQISMQPRAARGNEDPDKTATATQVETDLTAGRANMRLRRFEDALAEVAKKTMQMVHAMLPTLTLVRPAGYDEVLTLPWREAEMYLQQPGAELVTLGVEAIAGKDTVEWMEMPEGDAKGFISMLLRSVRITVERGSTQRHARLQKVASFRQVLAEVLLPACAAIEGGAPRVLAEAMKKILSMLGLQEFESITKELETIIESGQQAMADPLAAPGGSLPAPEQAQPPMPQMPQGGGNV